jgi:putative membrane protein
VSAVFGDKGDALAAFLADPINSVQTDFNPVANCGTGFAPYFSSLALWIGALFISLVIGRRIGNEKLNSDGFHATLGRYLVFACAGTIQAALLMVVLFLIGIEIAHVPLLLLGLFVASLTSIAIISTLISLFGMLGQMFAMVILIFQLTASGGTFPTELTQGGLFMALHPFVPFTYSINLLREALSGALVDQSVLWPAFGIQLSIAAVCLIVCAVVTNVRIQKQSAQLK